MLVLRLLQAWQPPLRVLEAMIERLGMLQLRLERMVHALFGLHSQRRTFKDACLICIP